MFAGLKQFLVAPSNYADWRLRFWFSLSLVFTGIYGLLGVGEALSNPYIFHDDVRSHVFWMRRFLDPDLFPQDFIADYFQSVAPYGYVALYRAMAAVGIDPVLFNKFLPLGLVFITAIYCFWTCLRLLPVPVAGFIATVFLNQMIWNTHDVASGTPRAFIYPLLLAFLYYLGKRSLTFCLVTIALQGLFYPQCLFLSAGILVLRLLRFGNGRLHVSSNRSDYLFCFAGLGVVGLMLLPYALKISEFGPVITAAQGRQLPILQSTGRKHFFADNFWEFWFCGGRSGIIPRDWCKRFPPPPAWLALALPWLLRSPHRFPLAKKVSEAAVLGQILFASLGMFVLAHWFLFKLHLPSRYTRHSLKILVALAGAIALVLFLDAVLRACETKIAAPRRHFFASGCFVVLTAVVLGYPFLVEDYPNPDYVKAESPALYGFFAQQPNTILIASLSEEANNIPTLSQRSILTSSEIAVPYHLGYYREIQKRTLDLIHAHYSQDLTALKELIQRYSVDFLLLDRKAFTAEYVEKNRWLRENQTATEAIASLRRGEVPALAKRLESCSVFETSERIVLQADCILKAEPADNSLAQYQEFNSLID